MSYVPKEYGVPFLQGSHLPQLRPYDVSDPAEPWSWLGRLWLLRPHVDWDGESSPCFWIEDAMRDGNVLQALDAAIEAVERELHDAH